MTFRTMLELLTRPMDATAHAAALDRLQRCRSIRDLEELAATGGGWLEPDSGGARLKLVRHGSGAFLIVSYDDGWSSTVSRTA